MSTVNFSDTTPAAPAGGPLNVHWQSDASGNISANYTPGNFLTWTPTVISGGGMTVSGVSISDATYLRFGPMVLFKFNISCTLGGTSSTGITVSLPPFPIVGASSTCACLLSPAGVPSEAGWTFLNSSGVNAQRTHTESFPLGSLTIACEGFYQIV